MGRTAGRGTIAAVVVAMAVSVSACAFVPRPLPERGGGGGSSLRAPCTQASMRSCALPYPSDEFTELDRSTATGRRVVVPDGVLPPAVHRALGPGAGVQDAFDGADGFSAVSPVMFELDRAVDPATLPADGGEVVRVFDTATGERVPVRAEVTLDAIRQGAPGTIVAAWPQVRWEYGHTYVARVTTGLQALVGSLVRAPGVLDPEGYLDSVRADLAAHRRRSVGGRGVGHALHRPQPAQRQRRRWTGWPPRPGPRTTRCATSASWPRCSSPGRPPSSRVRSGCRTSVMPTGWPGTTALPRRPGSGSSWCCPSAPPARTGAPVVVYGHGLTVAKETMLAVASTNAALGLATIGIDVPNHGDRQSDEGGYLLDLASPGSFGRLASMPVQGIVDVVSLLEAVQHHLGGLDAGPWRPDGTHGDGVADLDPSRLLYEGTSMGGVLGGASVALAPELDGAFLQVAGSGIADIIFHSLLWPVFAPVVPDGASAGDAAALQGAATMLLDRSDNVNVIDRLRGDGPPLFLQYGVGDGIVPNATSARMAVLADLPLVGPELTPLPDAVRRTGTDTIPADGRGVAQVFNTNSSWEAMSFLAHVSFIEPPAQALLQAWLRNRLAAMGLTPP